MASSLRQAGVAVRALVLFTVVLGVAYPLAMTGVAQVLFHDQANGSIVRVHGQEVASSLIGQQYGERWFQTRPSAADYDGMGSAASQYGPNNPELVRLIDERRRAVAELEGVSPDRVPPDAVTASGSGLDPHISPAYAALQVNRVARARGLPVAEVRKLVQENTEGRTFGFLGEPRVNVVSLNAALAAL
ncbi:potassium-transporting ATPase subunit KdpC [Kribbella turkmenica]|uniref:Potassium-transporting ATPase KdpC subunit n=2 Tax=Kribbella turkmenica TaxID=2530375 RepID=A0A4R4XD90_9ACTN|nr:potassium-transporting ATPase subunit KdpC [Kribbella turkmenica]TDD28731.1 potassium-transporting ATPase subunit KdpC [Kribbella turkmenica]